MNIHATDGYGTLTEKEKQTLRLIVRGHDAKSIARHFGLSVYTVNDRLRDERRKLAASSSREAARRLLDREGPDFLAPDGIGGAIAASDTAGLVAPENGGERQRLAWIIGGVTFMSLILALAAVISQPLPVPADTTPAATARTAEVETAARAFLTLIDQGKWDESYARTTASFQKLNSRKVWADVSARVRPPLGPVALRTMVSHEDVPAPPHGYEIVKFRTSFANKQDAIEKVSLERAGGDWRVAGVWIE